jgi:hypothetical protein
MSILILSNTSGQIDFTLKEGFTRLTGGFVGPTELVDGFTVQDGNQQTGIYVGNSCIQLCKNTIDFKEVANVNLLVPNTRCFSVSGNGSNFLFNEEGTVSFGSGIDTNYKGVQSYSTNPSLVLRNTNSTCNQAVRFLNNAGIESFYICQNDGLGVSICGKCLELSTSSGPSICLSGDHISFNAPIDSSYNNLFNGSTFLSGGAYLRGNTTGSGIFCYFNSDSAIVGLSINTCSYFCKNAAFSGGLFVTGNTSFLCSDNYICSRTGYFTCSSGSVSNYETSYNKILCINDYGSITEANGLNFTGNKTAFLSGICTSGVCIPTGYFNSTLPNGLNISGNLNLTGSLNIRSPLSSPTTNLISGCSFQLISTSTAITWPNNISGNLSISGCLSGTETSYFRNFCSFGSTISCFLGPVCVDNTFCTKSICAENITGNTISGNQLISGNCGYFNCFQQIKGTEVSCFSSSGLNVGLSQTGVIKSANTSKAWGVLGISAGGATFCCGFNLKSAQIYAQNTTSTSLIYAHGICFCEPIKYPFLINFNVYGLTSAITGVSSTNTAFGLSPSPLGFTGVTTIASPVIGAGTGVSPINVQLYSNMGRCSTDSKLSLFQNGSTYSEIYFNFTNCKGGATPYSDLTRANASGVIHFNILGY